MGRAVGARSTGAIEPSTAQCAGTDSVAACHLGVLSATLETGSPIAVAGISEPRRATVQSASVMILSAAGSGSLEPAAAMAPLVPWGSARVGSPDMATAVRMALSLMAAFPFLGRRTRCTRMPVEYPATMHPHGEFDERSSLFSEPARPRRSPRANRTLASDLAEHLRADILHCRLKPNARLRFRDLKATYESGMSPLREALMRLASEGLVVLEDHKGFRVAPVSRGELTDIAETRCELEALAVRLSIERGGDDWRAVIEARFGALIERATYDDEGRLDPEWEARHDAFHRALYAACGLRWLSGFCHVLADRAFRYRHLLLEAVDRQRDHRREHEEIKDAVVGGDASQAIALLQRHYMETVRTLLANCRDLA